MRVMLGERGYEEAATAVGLIVGAFWFGMFCLSVPEGAKDFRWWLIAVPLTVVVLAALFRGIHVLGSGRTRGRRIALVMALAPVIAILCLVAGLLLAW